MDEPRFFIAGDTVEWSKSLAAYPPDSGWTLTYYFWNIEVSFFVEAVEDNGAYLVRIQAVDSEKIYPGKYIWKSVVSKGAGVTIERHTIDTGEVAVKHNPAKADGKGIDTRSETKRALDNVNAVIARTATSDQLSYSIEGRSLQRRSYQELKDLRNDLEQRYAQELQEERFEQGLGGTKIHVRFR